MVEFTLSYEGALRCTATHGPSGAVLPTDAPADNLGRGESFSPTDLCATSLGVCMLTTMGILAERKGFAFPAGATGTVRKIMTATPPRRIARIEIDLVIPLPGNHPERADLERVALNCPVALSLHPQVEKAVTFRWA